MDRLEAMSVIIAVTETGSFSAASRRLGIPVATVSRKVSELECRLKAELFQRSSRRMTLTDAGRAYIEACKRIIEQVDDAEREVSGEYGVPKGDLAVTAPWGLGHMHLLPIAVEFLDAYPEISLRLVLTVRVVNTVEENIDVAIRIGSLPDSSMIATRIGSIRLVICGSPSYLAARGTPNALSDLHNHDCIGDRRLPGQTIWKFRKGVKQRDDGSIEALCEYVRGCHHCGDRGRWIDPVMSYKMDTADRRVRWRSTGGFQGGAFAGPHRLCAAQSGAAETARLPQLVTPRLKARLAG